MHDPDGHVNGEVGLKGRPLFFSQTQSVSQDKLQNYVFKYSFLLISSPPLAAVRQSVPALFSPPPSSFDLSLHASRQPVPASRKKLRRSVCRLRLMTIHRGICCREGEMPLTLA